MLTKNWKSLAVLCALTLSLTAVQAQAASISVDIGADPSPTQAGFTAWHFNESFNSSAAQSEVSPTFFLGADDFTATISQPTSHGFGHDTHTGTAGTFDDLETGGIFGRDFFTLTFTGLDAGTYSLKTYNYYGLASQDGPVVTTVTDSLGSNAGQTIDQLDGVALDGGPENIGDFTFVSTGGALSILFNRTGSTADNISLNGFTLESAAIPEPSTLVLAGIGLFGLLACGRRRRRRDEAAVLNRNST